MRSIRPIAPGTVENRVYQYIIAYKTANDGASPTFREIGAHIGVKSTSMVTFYLGKLQKAGLIQLTNYRTGHIRLMGGRYVFEGGNHEQ